jgi:hypothetical protein
MQLILFSLELLLVKPLFFAKTNCQISQRFKKFHGLKYKAFCQLIQLQNVH